MLIIKESLETKKKIVHKFLLDGIIDISYGGRQKKKKNPTILE